LVLDIRSWGKPGGRVGADSPPRQGGPEKKKREITPE